MGSGPRRSNIRAVAPSLGAGGVIHCPDDGSLRASEHDAAAVGSSGYLQLDDHRVLLMVGEKVVAWVAGEGRLSECLRAGFEYGAAPELRDDVPVIRYWRA